MSRIPELQTDSMTPEQRTVADEIISGPHGRIVGPYNAWLNSPEFARRARSLSEFVRFKSSLPNNLSELAILITGRHWKAEFEFYAHRILGRKAGLDDAVIDAIAENRRPEFQNGDEEIVYDFCTEMYETRRVSDAIYERAVKAFGVPTVVELIGTIGYYCMVSMTLNAFQVGLPEGESSPFPE